MLSFFHGWGLLCCIPGAEVVSHDDAVDEAYFPALELSVELLLFLSLLLEGSKAARLFSADLYYLLHNGVVDLCDVSDENGLVLAHHAQLVLLTREPDELGFALLRAYPFVSQLDIHLVLELFVSLFLEVLK